MSASKPLADVSPELARLLTHGGLPPALFGVAEISCTTAYVPMRDGTRLATDLYLPPVRPAPVVATRTPYLRGADALAATLMTFARRGYAVVSQDCRGTGDSEPDSWDYCMFECEDGYDLVDWISHQDWCASFISACGASYAGQTQWPMATHPSMSTIAPHVSGLGIAIDTVHFHMFCNGYARVVGKGAGKLAEVHYSEIERLIEPETMATGYFNAPLHKPIATALLANFPQVRAMDPARARHWLWEQYCSLNCARRVEFAKGALETNSIEILDMERLSEIFGHEISRDAHALPCANVPELCRRIQVPALLLSGWYDWCLNDTLATWEALRREGREKVAARTRMIITPHAHNTLGYREGIDTHSELQLMPSMLNHAGVLLRWYEAVREQRVDSWPVVIYYLMGANEWCAADDWPVPDARQLIFYLASGGGLTTHAPAETSKPDCYTYDPDHPTPTVGGNILSYLYPVGSVDVSVVQQRADVLVYTTLPLDRDLDVVGPLRMILYASSSAVDTDFAARISDVFPDGRAIQLQSTMLRARYRNPEPELLEPGRVYRLEIDMWATANRFKAGHCLRLDITSADFPKFDRNTNLGGMPGKAIPAHQTVYHDPERPSHLQLSVLP